MTLQKYLILDYETRSKADLKKIGAHEYALHPSTKILCVSWKLGTRDELKKGVKTKSWTPWISGYPGYYFGELLQALTDPNIILVAHSALFEQVITRYVFAPLMYTKKELTCIPHDRWICTASLAAALALPRSLDGACSALGLKHQKDMEGHKLMLKMCKPRKATKNNKAMWHSTVPDLKRLIEYCERDIGAETDLFLKLPPLSNNERRVWLLDQKINFRGFRVDRELVKKVLSLISEEIKNLNDETKEISGIESTNKVKELLSWVRSSGVEMDNMQAKTVADTLEFLSDDGGAKRLLEIRQAVSRTSTAKYSAMDLCSQSDSRVRQHLLYHGASTGRWSGRGVQIHNFKRGNIKDINAAASTLKSEDLETIRLLYGEPMIFFSNALKGMIIPSLGKEFFCADYSAIEARVLFWMAKHKKGIQAYLDNRDLYKELAKEIYNRPENLITSTERFVGKKGTLGAGFGLGWKQFLKSCLQEGLSITEVVAKKTIETYRSVHYPVPQMWRNLEGAAIAAVQNPGKKYTVNYTTWFCANNFLWCVLPSGRKLAYYGPEIRYDQTPWGEKKATLYHYSVDPMTKKWVLAGTYGGKLTENVVSGTARDIMASAMLRVEAAKYDVLFTVHDEILGEKEIGKGSLKEFINLMTTIPEWAKGCPIKAEGWTDVRYKKG